MARGECAQLGGGPGTPGYYPGPLYKLPRPFTTSILGEMAEEQQSPELTVFKEQSDTIRTGILNNVQHDVAQKAYSRSLISDKVHRDVTGTLNRLMPDERTDLFMAELEQRIRNDPTVLMKFVNLLRQSDAAYYKVVIDTISTFQTGLFTQLILCQLTYISPQDN